MIEDSVLDASSPEMLAKDGELRSLKAIIALPDEVKDEWVRRFLPEGLLQRFGIDRATFQNALGERVVEHTGNLEMGEVRLVIWRRLSDRDPVAVAEACDTSTGQIELTFLATADPDAPRFDVDVDEQGRTTLLGTARRNIPAEIAAMEAGLAPGQVRRGLALVNAEILPMFEMFLAAIGHDYVLAYPLAYHNAILMERWGFDYLYGRKFMEELDERFSPGGDLRARLDGSTPFRRPQNADTARGRSWALHDGILDAEMEPIKLVKRVGHTAHAETFLGHY